MSIKFDVPDEYVDILKNYAEENHKTVETALADTFEFLELKDESFSHYHMVVEHPKQYLNDADGLNATAIRQLYMDLFGEDTVGDEAACYYDPDRLDVLFLDMQYDTEVPLWNVLEMFQNRIPGMSLTGDTLTLYFIGDRFHGLEEIEAVEEWLADPSHEDQDDGGRHETKGYYETIFDDAEDDEDFDDEI